MSGYKQKKETPRFKQISVTGSGEGYGIKIFGLAETGVVYEWIESRHNNVDYAGWVALKGTIEEMP